MRERHNRGCNAGADPFFGIRFVSTVVGNESSDNGYVAHKWGMQNKRFAKKSPQSTSFAKKGSVEQKVWEPLIYAGSLPKPNYLKPAVLLII